MSALDSKVRFFLQLLIYAHRKTNLTLLVANRGLYSTIVLLLHFFTWERQPLGEAEKKKVFPTFRAARECSLDVDAVKDTATPTEAQAIPFSAGIKFTCRDPEGFSNWIESVA